MSRQITSADMALLARGAAILGTGGGGDPHIGRLLAEQALRRRGPVELVDVADVPDDACAITVGMMGAPTVMIEKVPTVDQIGESVRTLARYLGREVTHIACAEAGGVNSTVPFVAAAELGLPLVDGDGMGRAFPELQMVLPTLIGVRATPMSIMDEKGNAGIFDTINNHWAETLARSATIDMGCSAIVAMYAMDGRQLREGLVHDTLSLCIDLGAQVEDARAEHRDPVDAVATRLGGRALYHGKVVDVARRTQTGFARGDARIAPMSGDGAEMILRFQNEHLIAELDGTAVTTTPDLIMVLDAETGEPITTEGLRYGARVSVVAAPADPRWHSPAGIELVGPRYFGYDLDPVPAPVSAGPAGVPAGGSVR